MDSKGQISLEYLLIFAISLILLIVFTLPMAELTIKDTLDVSDAMNVKDDLSKIAQAIKQVYGEGQGSKQTLTIDSSKDIKVNVNRNHISCNLKLNDNSRKVINVDFNSNLAKSTIQLDKGENIIVVEWPDNEENMVIYEI